MLAYLFQEEPELVPGWLAEAGLPAMDFEGWKLQTQRAVPGGFLDLVLFVPGKALVIIESKLGSTTAFDQVAKYVRYAREMPVDGVKALILLTQHPEPWPSGVEAETGGEVTLIRRRWQDMADFLREQDSALTSDFVAMLEKEGLVKPDALTHADWDAWRTGSMVSLRLATLLRESLQQLKEVQPGFKSAGPVVFTNDGGIYRLLHFEHLSVAPLFWPVRQPETPGAFANVVLFVLNTSLPASERKQAGEQAVSRAASSNVGIGWWNEYYVHHGTPAHEVLTADTFEGQMTQLAEHTRATLAYFRSLGYLPTPAASALVTSAPTVGS
jgi:hypothetical protein